MGECGCGKTELVRYMCLSALDSKALSKGLVLRGAWMKLPLLTLNVHGGTTEQDIDEVFREAMGMAAEAEGLVVFLDEINTSQHVNMLCEAVLERSYRASEALQRVGRLAPRRPGVAGDGHGAGGLESTAQAAAGATHHGPGLWGGRRGGGRR